MEVTVNGQKTDIEEPCSIAQWLERSERPGPTLAVELNGDVIPREAHASTWLCHGDTLEVVTLVGGG